MAVNSFLKERENRERPWIFGVSEGINEDFSAWINSQELLFTPELSVYTRTELYGISRDFRKYVQHKERWEKRLFPHGD
jgi:hypothetical protein